MRISVDRLGWSAGDQTIIRDIQVEIASGETVGLIGPNGSGKSTLLRCLAGLRTATTGTVRYDGQDIRDWSTRRIARHTAFAEQSAASGSDLTVADVVALGRTPFRTRWRGLDRTDHMIISAALARMDLTALRDRTWPTLSGGERQRAHIARALAQRPRAILLDEPTNHLDIKHQLQLMHLLGGTPQTVLIALHDLSLAARYCDRLLLMNGGVLVAAGTPQSVLTPARLREVFEVDAEIGLDGLGHRTVTYRGVATSVTSTLPDDRVRS
ncbi:ABC transporter ATP-binding protein [Micromonospora sp. WMMD882]|uniref:ABC transporter ATP-binding protein n=1 Tax=Micromonospora sp. WMMD882 TaxID=3015151 RepID=UPI00248C7C96|nr:ABC transporter ATP-binding protein [Micromonospora sp. WMMD882]WBB78488.1 ABC transporter ATP-binding protein [Micromonospora sp. WMMD882]